MRSGSGGLPSPAESQPARPPRLHHSPEPARTSLSLHSALPPHSGCSRGERREFPTARRDRVVNFPPPQVFGECACFVEERSSDRHTLPRVSAGSSMTATQPEGPVAPRRDAREGGRRRPPHPPTGTALTCTALTCTTLAVCRRPSRPGGPGLRGPNGVRCACCLHSAAHRPDPAHAVWAHLHWRCAPAQCQWVCPSGAPMQVCTAPPAHLRRTAGAVRTPGRGASVRFAAGVAPRPGRRTAGSSRQDTGAVRGPNGWGPRIGSARSAATGLPSQDRRRRHPQPHAKGQAAPTPHQRRAPPDGAQAISAVPVRPVIRR